MYHIDLMINKCVKCGRNVLNLCDSQLLKTLKALFIYKIHVMYATCLLCKPIVFGETPKWETPKRVLLQTLKTQMKCSIMLHFSRVYTVCKGKKYFQTK